MEVTCENCNTRFNIPDDKLPPNRRVAISCPKCKHRIIIQPHEQESGETPTVLEDEAVFEKEYYDQDYLAPDTFEEGKKLAMVMAGEKSDVEALKTAVESLGYQGLEVESTTEAFGRLRFHHFDLLLLTDGFDGHPAAQNPILEYINRQSMSIRRRMFLTLIGHKFKTKDNMTAYSFSANLVVNEKDIDKLAAILKTAIAENERFYKIFLEILVEIGRV
ncbi:MAG: zinc-ribbon domain-containing protein [Desulfatiglandaceae bacterium]